MAEGVTLFLFLAGVSALLDQAARPARGGDSLAMTDDALSHRNRASSDAAQRVASCSERCAASPVQWPGTA